MSIGPVTGARTMYDSTNGFDIPQGVEMVAYYVDGLYAWSDAMIRYHSGSRLVGITVTGETLAADVVDMETGDASPAQAADWAHLIHAAGRYPVIYVQESRIGEVQRALAAYPAFPVGYWRANWNNSADLYPNDIAHQYADSAMLGQHYDKSVVRPYWPGVDPAPAPAPAPTPAPSPAPPPPAPAPVPLPTPAPVPPPVPVPSDPSSAQQSFWALAASVLGQGIPRLLSSIWEQVKALREI